MRTSRLQAICSHSRAAISFHVMVMASLARVLDKPNNSVGTLIPSTQFSCKGSGTGNLNLPHDMGKATDANVPLKNRS